MTQGAEPVVTGIDHVDVYARDLVGARTFFERILGADVLGASEDHTFLLFGDQVVGLRRDRSGTGSPGVHHLAPRVDRWEGLSESLRSRGAEIREEKTRDESRSKFLEGPEGLQLELIHRPDPGRHPEHPE
ncbi:MAG TPA: VOC family protein [Thermoplasmata archaeon]|nr:VOC family protein [Thermoplasmata archaeon]